MVSSFQPTNCGVGQAPPILIWPPGFPTKSATVSALQFIVVQSTAVHFALNHTVTYFALSHGHIWCTVVSFCIFAPNHLDPAMPTPEKQSHSNYFWCKCYHHLTAPVWTLQCIGAQQLYRQWIIVQKNLQLNAMEFLWKLQSRRTQLCVFECNVCCSGILCKISQLNSSKRIFLCNWWWYGKGQLSKK